MSNVSFQEVRNKCREGRFFSYDGFNDKIYSPISVILVWVFVRLGWSGNAVSILSGIVAMAGATLIASSNEILVVIGSFGYMLFYLLDYVDGGVARFRGSAGIGGQYVDWAMHVVSSVGFATGILAGAITMTGQWIIPLGVLTVVASALALDRYALGWFAICMHYQQQLVKNEENLRLEVVTNVSRPNLFFRINRKIATILFHENNAIYLFPALAIGQYYFPIEGYDFRVILIISGGLIYFPVVLFDLVRMAKQGYIDKAYNNLFQDKVIPKLPKDHFFGE
jgi:hypothetical protein